ncbi:hypothetical protein ABW19_dt0206157 [Dactylella cylindrospora]|nr:hypothetical protein ABW19_dt0206157 [Dactylella cylindrospora]
MELLLPAFEDSPQRLLSLEISNIPADMWLEMPPAMAKQFESLCRGLTTLVLSFPYGEALLNIDDEKPRVLHDVLSACSDTLLNLKLTICQRTFRKFAKHDCSIKQIFSDEGGTPILFPRLERLELKGFSTSEQAMVELLQFSMTPKLRSLSLGWACLTNCRVETWKAVMMAAHPPPTLEEILVACLAVFEKNPECNVFDTRRPYPVTQNRNAAWEDAGDVPKPPGWIAKPKSVADMRAVCWMSVRADEEPILASST